MSDLFAGDGQFDLAATTETDIFTGPDGYQSTVEVWLCNRTAGALTFRLAISKAGAPSDVSHYLYFDTNLPANDSVVVKELPVNESDVLRAYASAVGVSANVLVQDARKIAEPL